MSADRQPIRTVLEDKTGNTLTIVTEFFGPYCKLFAEYKMPDKELMISTPFCWEAGDAEFDALHEKKVSEAVKSGWREVAPL